MPFLASRSRISSITPSFSNRVSCRNYDLCENCIKFEEVHYKEHKFLVIEAPQEKAKFDRVSDGSGKP